MKIEFHTLDNHVSTKECPDVTEPFSGVIMSPMWQKPFDVNGERPFNFQNYRRYEWRGELNGAVPIVYETHTTQ